METVRTKFQAWHPFTVVHGKTLLWLCFLLPLFLELKDVLVFVTNVSRQFLYAELLRIYTPKDVVVCDASDYSTNKGLFDSQGRKNGGIGKMKNWCGMSH